MVTKKKQSNKIKMRTLPFALGCPKCSNGGFKTVSYNHERVIVQHVNSPECEYNGKMYKFSPSFVDVEEL